jgi:hypothetical protein
MLRHDGCSSRESSQISERLTEQCAGEGASAAGDYVSDVKALIASGRIRRKPIAKFHSTPSRKDQLTRKNTVDEGNDFVPQGNKRLFVISQVIDTFLGD